MYLYVDEFKKFISAQELNEIFEMKTSVHLTLKLPGALKLPGDPFESPIAFGHPSNLTDGFSSIAEQHKILFQDTKKYDVNM